MCYPSFVCILCCLHFELYHNKTKLFHQDHSALMADINKKKENVILKIIDPTLK